MFRRLYLLKNYSNPYLMEIESYWIYSIHFIYFHRILIELMFQIKLDTFTVIIVYIEGKIWINVH